MRRVDLIALHCSDSPFGDAALIRSWHLERGFREIGYHYVILNGYPDGDSHRLRRPKFWLDGVVEPGRPVEEPGAHVERHNAESVGICLIGREQFTSAQFASLCKLLAELRRSYPDARLMGHCELIAPGSAPKSCPNLDMDWIRQFVDESIRR